VAGPGKEKLLKVVESGGEVRLPLALKRQRHVQHQPELILLTPAKVVKPFADLVVTTTCRMDLEAQSVSHATDSILYLACSLLV